MMAGLYYRTYPAVIKMAGLPQTLQYFQIQHAQNDKVAKFALSSQRRLLSPLFCHVTAFDISKYGQP